MGTDCLTSRVGLRALVTRDQVATIAVIAVVLVLLLRTLASMVPVSSSLTVEPRGGDAVVVSVVPLSHEWLLGVRPGSDYERLADGGAIVETSAGSIDVPDLWPVLPPHHLLAVVTPLAIALAVRRIAPGIAWLALVIATSVAVWELPGYLIGPLAACTVVAPSAVALVLCLGPGPPETLRTYAALMVVAAAVTGVAALALAGPQVDGAFRLPAATAVLVAVALVAGPAVVRAVRAWRTSGDSVAAAVTVLRASDVGRRMIRSVVEEERDRMAQRIHDRVMPRMREGLHALETGDLGASARTFRGLAGALHVLLVVDQLVVLRDGGLEHAIADAAANTEDGPEVMVVGASAGHPSDPPWEVAVATLRIAQEAIANARRHASADVIRVKLRSSPRQVVLEVEDDGVGIDPDSPPHVPRHIGLAEMRDRAREVGGDLRIEPAVPSGTIVRFVWSASAWRPADLADARADDPHSSSATTTSRPVPRSRTPAPW